MTTSLEHVEEKMYDFEANKVIPSKKNSSSIEKDFKANANWV